MTTTAKRTIRTMLQLTLMMIVTGAFISAKPASRNLRIPAGLTLNQLEESAIGASVNFNDDFVDFNSNEDEEDLEDSGLGGGRKDYPSDFRWPESYFDLEASSDVAVVVGQPAFLVCRVAVAGNWTVSWVRHRDINLLTVGTDTYTPDRRFRGLHVPNSPEWTLQIKATTLDDAGDYECQLSSTPLRTHVIRLRIIEPYIQILNGPEVYVHEGSTLNLTCVISPAVDASLFLWSRNGQVLNWMYQSNEVVGVQLDARIEVYDGRLWVDRGGGNAGATEEVDTNEAASNGDDTGDDASSDVDAIASSLTAGPPNSDQERRSNGKEIRTATISQLLVDKAQMFHSGRYVCSAVGSTGTWTLVHILADEQPAAMQRGNPASSFQHPLMTGWIALSVSLIHRYLVT